jgi:hypothetical protein
MSVLKRERQKEEDRKKKVQELLYRCSTCCGAD